MLCRLSRILVCVLCTLLASAALSLWTWSHWYSATLNLNRFETKVERPLGQRQYVVVNSPGPRYFQSVVLAGGRVTWSWRSPVLWPTFRFLPKKWIIEPLPLSRLDLRWDYGFQRARQDDPRLPPGNYWSDDRALGFRLYRRYDDGRCREWSLAIPCWAPTLLLFLPPAVFALRFIQSRRRLRRHNKGLCPNCAYDLRASTTRCPECGHPIPPSPS